MTAIHHAQGASAAQLDNAATQFIRCAFTVAPGLAPEERLELARYLRRRMELLDQHWPGDILAEDDEAVEEVMKAGSTFQRLADLLEEGLPPQPAAPVGRPRLSVQMAFEASAGMTEEERAAAISELGRKRQSMKAIREFMINTERIPGTADSPLSLYMAAMANDLYDLATALDQPEPVYLEQPEATLRISPAGEIEAFNTKSFPMMTADYHRPARARALVHVTHAGRVMVEPLKPTELAFDLEDPIQAAHAATFASKSAARAMLMAAGGKLGFDVGQVLAGLLTELETADDGRHLDQVPTYQQAIRLLDALGHLHSSPFAERVRA